MTSPAAPESLAAQWPHRRRANPWVRRLLVLAACALLLDAIYGDQGLARTTRARRDRQQAVAALDALRRENAEMREEAARLQRDPTAIEAVARRDLGLIRRGEILIVVKDRK
jgi:cell division protein FtsB